MIETLEHPKLFCFRVDRWPKWVILLVCSVGIFGSFLLHGVAHEKLFSAPYFFKETLFLTFAQFFSYSAMSLPGLARIIRNRVPLKAPWSVYLLTTFCLAMSMSLANFAAMRLSYATKVLFKSSKLIPVMIGNIIFLKKKPKATEVLSVVLIVIGLVGISLGDFRGKNKFDVPGIIGVTLSLCFDAISSNMEDKILSHYGASQDELIAVLYGLGALSVGSFALIQGDFVNGILRCARYPSSLIYLAAFSGLGSIGIQFVYLTMKVFGSLLTVMLTSIRKALSVCLSFILFPETKRFTKIHAISVCFLAVGMAIHIREKTKKHAEKEPVEEVHEHLEDGFEVMDDVDQETQGDI